MHKEEIDYDADMELDKHSLDHEWLRQSSLYLKYSILYADLASFRDEAKEELAKVDALIDLEVRSDWEDFGFEVKPTEPAIKAAILQDDRHIKASKDYIFSLREVNIAQGARTALDHKKAALERLSSLFLAGYWADPKITKEAQDGYSENVQEAHRSHLGRNERIK
jgi:hypothetical protein